jgi:hypothetical protein
MLSLFTQVGVKCRVLPFLWFAICKDWSHSMYIHRPLMWMVNTVRKEDVFYALTKVVFCAYLYVTKSLQCLFFQIGNLTIVRSCLFLTDWQQSDTWIRRSVDCTGFCSLLSWLFWICGCSSNPHHHWGKCCSIRIFRFVLSLLYMCTIRMWHFSDQYFD